MTNRVFVGIVSRNFRANIVDTVGTTTTGTVATSAAATGTSTGTQSALPRVLEALECGALRDERRAQCVESHTVGGEGGVCGLELLASGDGGGGGGGERQHGR